MSAAPSFSSKDSERSRPARDDRGAGVVASSRAVPSHEPVAVAADGSDAPARSRGLLQSSVGRALALLGIVAMLAVPSAYLYFKVDAVEAEMRAQAQDYAAFVSSRLPAADSAWQTRLAEIDRQYPQALDGESWRIVRDASGRILAQSGWVREGQALSISLPLQLGPQASAQIDMVRSARPLIWNVLGVGAIVLMLGALTAMGAVLSYRRTRSQEVEAEAAGLRPEVEHNGLLTRRAFIAALEQTMARSRAQGGESSVFNLDLDHFKMINGKVGQSWAEVLLDQVAEVVRRRVDALTQEAGLPPAQICAPGGDVLLILVENLPKTSQVSEAFARGVLDALSEPFEVGPYQQYVSACIGASHGRGREITAEALVREAETAKLFAKQQGSGSYAIHDVSMDAQAAARDELGQQLREALARQEFELYYQPKVHMVTGTVTGVEALLRWNCRDGRMGMPDQFIPVLEETGLIVPVGAWVMRQACRQVMQWRERGLPPINVAVNVSARQLQQPHFVQTVSAALKESGLEAEYLELELTESIFVDNAAENIRMLRQLAEMGVSLAIDDFGTGHSSFSYLSNFSPRTLKIDRSFLIEAPDGADNIAIARAIIALGHGMGLYVVAEGVETEAQADFLRDYGCDQMQGYLLSRPQSADNMEQWLRARLLHEQRQARARRFATV